MKNRIYNSLFFCFVLIIFMFLVYNNYSFFKEYKEIAITSSKDAIALRMSSLSVDLNRFPRTSVNDISYLSKISGTRDFYESGINLEKNDLLEFMKQNSAYYQLVLLDLDGNGVFKVENLNNNYSNDFLNKEKFLNNNFWQEVKNLDDGTVIVSDIILEENMGNSIPVLSYAAVIYDNGVKSGYLILKANANYFLEDIRHAKREGEDVFLLRLNGEYLANYNQDKEFSLEKGVSFYSDYPELSKEDISLVNEKIIETKENLILLKYITISKGYFTEYSGGEDNIWALAFVTDKSELNLPTFRKFLIKEIPILLLILLFIILEIVNKLRNNK